MGITIVMLAPVLLAGVAVARCSSTVGQSADAGEDTPPWHYHRDASPDDAAMDALDEPDAGVDACAITSDWPGFRRLTEFDRCQANDVLVDRDAGYHMAWTDCADAGLPDCKELVPLAPGPGVFEIAYASHDDAGSGGALYLSRALGNYAPLGALRQYDVVDLKTNELLGEWRIDLNAPTNDIDLLLTDSTDTTMAFLGYYKSLAALAPAATLAAQNPMALQPFIGPVQDIEYAVSDQVGAFLPLNGQFHMCTFAKTPCVPVSLSNILPAIPYLTFAWHDTVFAVAEHGTTGWAEEYVIHPDGTIALLRSKPNTHIWAMATDGITLVWKEVTGSINLQDPQTTAEVWKAPMTTDKATLDATAAKVGMLPTASLGGGPRRSDVAFFNGLYSTYFGQHDYAQTIYTIDVNTSRVQSSPVGPGGSVSGIPYVDRSAIWQVTMGTPVSYHIVRIPFSQPWN